MPPMFAGKPMAADIGPAPINSSTAKPRAAGITPGSSLRLCGWKNRPRLGCRQLNGRRNWRRRWRIGLFDRLIQFRFLNVPSFGFDLHCAFLVPVHQNEDVLHRDHSLANHLFQMRQQQIDLCPRNPRSRSPPAGRTTFPAGRLCERRCWRRSPRCRAGRSAPARPSSRTFCTMAS